MTEGSVGIWERLAYDWSDPSRIVLTTTDSNVFGGRSGHTYTLTGGPTGPPRWTSSWSARARTSAAGCCRRCSGPSVEGLLERRFKGTVKAIEGRNRDGD